MRRYLGPTTKTRKSEKTGFVKKVFKPLILRHIKVVDSERSPRMPATRPRDTDSDWPILGESGAESAVTQAVGNRNRPIPGPESGNFRVGAPESPDSAARDDSRQQQPHAEYAKRGPAGPRFASHIESRICAVGIAAGVTSARLPDSTARRGLSRGRTRK